MIRCEFTLAGKGPFPTSRKDFENALKAPFPHYTDNHYTCKVGVMGASDGVGYTLEIDWKGVTAEQVRQDMTAIAASCGKELRNFRVTP